MYKSVWDAPSTSDYFNSIWDTSDMADAWADYGDHAEDMWSDAEDEWDMTDVEADANTFASAGWGTDEDYSWYGEQVAAYWDA